ncbi:MAG: hypothetical protein ACPHVT_05285 [Porticoccaceae bacterium]
MRPFYQSAINLLLLCSVAACGSLYAQDDAEDIKPNPVIVPLAPEIPQLPVDTTEPYDREIQPLRVESVATKPIAVPEYKKAKKEQDQNSD